MKAPECERIAHDNGPLGRDGLRSSGGLVTIVSDEVLLAKATEVLAADSNAAPADVAKACGQNVGPGYVPSMALLRALERAKRNFTAASASDTAAARAQT